jgi:uncharacterized protein (DUF2062 family)
MFKKVIDFAVAKLFKINDSDQKIALGVGLGVFLGFVPGTGPAAALFLSFVFKVNRAAALFGSMLTNTWLSLVTFAFSVKVGSLVLGRHWQDVYRKMQGLVADFHWSGFFKLSFADVILPVVTGYLIIGLCIGLFAYAITLVLIRKFLHRDIRQKEKK